MVYFVIILAIILLVIFVKAFNETKTSRRKHDFCCDKCNIRDLCSQYRAKKNIDDFGKKAN